MFVLQRTAFVALHVVLSLPLPFSYTPLRLIEFLRNLISVLRRENTYVLVVCVSLSRLLTSSRPIDGKL